MAKLTETEKSQLLRPTPPGTQPEPRLPMRSARAYVEFATFASNSTPVDNKPARFTGQYWKL